MTATPNPLTYYIPDSTIRVTDPFKDEHDVDASGFTLNGIIEGDYRVEVDVRDDVHALAVSGNRNVFGVGSQKSGDDSHLFTFTAQAQDRRMNVLPDEMNPRFFYPKNAIRLFHVSLEGSTASVKTWVVGIVSQRGGGWIVAEDGYDMLLYNNDGILEADAPGNTWENFGRLIYSKGLFPKEKIKCLPKYPGKQPSPPIHAPSMPNGHLFVSRWGTSQQTGELIDSDGRRLKVSWEEIKMDDDASYDQRQYLVPGSFVTIEGTKEVPGRSWYDWQAVGVRVVYQPDEINDDFVLAAR